MAELSAFSFHSLDEVREAFAQEGFDPPAGDDLSILATPVRYGRLAVPNRLVAQPMEGCDGTADGAPGELTLRKYIRLAAGGAGMIWFEACAVAGEARANPRQLWLHDGTAGAFADMVRSAREAAQQAGWPRQAYILQLTHSGRYCRPTDKPAPIIAHHSRVLDPRHGLSPEYPLIADEQLDALPGAYVRAAVLARQAGFDGVDIKSCHGYLLNELLASFTREGSRYGGSYENRTRMVRQTLAAVRRAVGANIEVTTRLSVSDAIDWPYGWGVDRTDAARMDLTEPLRLIGELRGDGLRGINITVGNPYSNPHVNRPADGRIAGSPPPPERPITGMIRILRAAEEVQRAFPDLTVIASGFAWLRQFGAQFAAGAIKAGLVSLAGFGRGALACPDFASDIIRGGGLDAGKVCITCAGCSQLMRDGQPSGCVVRDAAIYGPLLREGRSRQNKGAW
ncbi:MAG: flavin oxidoreductase/NADH oxidase [Phycisphaerae bacterium]